APSWPGGGGVPRRPNACSSEARLVYLRAHHHVMRFVTVVARVVWPASFAFASARVMRPFHPLQERFMRWQLSRSYGDPPRERGMSWSTTGLMGCGVQPGHVPPGHR